MKRKVGLSMALLCGALTAFAGPITCDQAAQNVSRFLQQEGLTRLSRSSMMSVASATRGQQPYYVFNIGENEGFVIASGDDAAYAILGYAREGHLDMDHLPDNMRAWLDGYARALRHIQSLHLPAQTQQAATYAAKENIEPLLTTKWAQDYPYHKLTPDFGDGYGHRPTGCVATAISQVMNFHQWPEGQTAKVGAYSYEDTYPGGDGSVKNIEALDPVTLDWDGMLDEYTVESDERSTHAVAQLMQYVGQSVKMVYGPYSSGAYATDMIPALVNVFGYKNSAQLLYREYESQQSWNDKIYEELANNRPVVYFGMTRSYMGHQFVCDGYENDFYHINWGWAGNSDGYFKLNVLNPESQGTGGAGDGSSFSEYQNAIFGLEKPVTEDRLYGRCTRAAQNADLRLDVKLDNYSGNLTAAEFDVKLPEGFSLKTGDDGTLQARFFGQRSAGGDHTVTATRTAEGVYHCSVQSPSGSRLQVSTGALVRLTLQADAGLKEQPYQGKLTNIVLKDAANHEKKLADSSFALSFFKVVLPLYGDANKDGMVTGADVKCVMDYILYLFPQPFDFTLADMNKDDVIDVADLMSVLDVVLKESGQDRHLADTQVDEADELSLALTDEGIRLDLRNTTGYKGIQFDVVLPAGTKLKDVVVDEARLKGFAPMFMSIADGRYRLVVCATDSRNITGSEGALLRFVTDTLPAKVQIANVVLVTTDLRKVTLKDLDYKVPTGIDAVTAAPAETVVYTLDGVRVKGDVKQLDKGIYIVNGSKVLVR